MVSYILPMGEDCGWVFLARPALRSWMEKFARIMNLKPYDASAGHDDWPRMVFLLKGAEKKSFAALLELPESGWEARDFPSLRFLYHRVTPDIICEIENDGNHELETIRMWMSLSIIYLWVQDSGGLPLHAALLERDGRGVLLAGPADSGKSTSCLRLTRPWRVLSDDQVLLVRDNRKGYLAHPIPTWTDCLSRTGRKTWDVCQKVPISAIFFLEQSNTDEVFQEGQGKSAMLINDSSTYVNLRTFKSLDAEEKRVVRKKIFDNACELAKTVPAFVLRTSLTGRFWEEMEKVL